jgi:hypothetical protein
VQGVGIRDVLLDEMLVKATRVDVEPAVRNDPPEVDRVATGLVQRHHLWLADDVWERQPR